MTKHSFELIFDKVRPAIERHTEGRFVHTMSAEVRFVILILFLRTNGHYNHLGNHKFVQRSGKAVGACIKELTSLFAEIASKVND
jgi:hypothetical protein